VWGASGLCLLSVFSLLHLRRAVGDTMRESTPQLLDEYLQLVVQFGSVNARVSLRTRLINYCAHVHSCTLSLFVCGLRSGLWQCSALRFLSRRQPPLPPMLWSSEWTRTSFLRHSGLFPKQPRVLGFGFPSCRYTLGHTSVTAPWMSQRGELFVCAVFCFCFQMLSLFAVITNTVWVYLSTAEETEDGSFTSSLSTIFPALGEVRSAALVCQRVHVGDVHLVCAPPARACHLCIHSRTRAHCHQVDRSGWNAGRAVDARRGYIP